MTLVRVPVAGTIGKAVRINMDATEGAQIGVDVTLPDGTTPSLAELASALYDASPPVFVSPNSSGSLGFVFETDVLDGIILARVADDERITGQWQFDSLTMTNAAAIEWLNIAGARIDFLNFEGSTAAEVEIDHYSNEVNSLQAATDSVSATTLHTLIPSGTLVDGDDYLVVSKTWYGSETGAGVDDDADNSISVSYGAQGIVTANMAARASQFVSVPYYGNELSDASIITADATSALLLKAISAPAPDNNVEVRMSHAWALNLTQLGSANYSDTTVFSDSAQTTNTVDTWNSAGSYTIGDGVSDYVLFINFAAVVSDIGASTVPDFHGYMRVSGGPWTDAELFEVGDTGQRNNQSYRQVGILILEAPAAGTQLQFQTKWSSFGGFTSAHGDIKLSLDIIALRLNDFVDYTIETSADLADPGGAGEVEVLTSSFTSSATSGDWGFLGGLSSYFPSSARDAITEIRADVNSAGDVDVAGQQDVAQAGDSAVRMLQAIIPVGTETNVNNTDPVDFGMFVNTAPSVGADEWDAAGMVAFSYYATVVTETYTVGDPVYPTWIDGLAVTIDSTLNVTGAVTFDSTLNVVGAVDFDSTLNVDGDTTLDDVSVGTIQFDLTDATAAAEGLLKWNSDDGTLEFGLPGGNVNIQIGQEHVIRARNTTGVTISNGSVIYVTGASGNKPLIALADASTANESRVIAVATEDIGHNSNGYCTTAGQVRDVNTNGMAVGSDLWLSETAGGYTTTKPVAPAHAVFVGHVIAEHTNNGVILVAITPDSLVNLDDFDLDLQAVLEIDIGVALDQPDVSVSSNGTVITFTFEQVSTGDVRFMFSDGVHIHDCTPIASIALTAGTDTSPTLNYVYILQSTKALTVSTAGWPAAEHAPLATVLCQSAASMQTDGAYKMHAWTDHSWNGEVGHLAHLNFWIRSQSATWRSGTLCTPTVGAATFDLAVASGSILQLHPHAYPSFDTSTGSEVMIVNQNGTPYDRVGNMVSQITDASGGSMSGKYYNLVVWGVVSEDSADCQLMVNLPTGSYNTSTAAILDADATTVYDIPTDFIGTGFLIARLVCRHQVSGNTYSISSNIDLRGKVPSTSAGGTVGGGVTSFSALSDGDTTGLAQDDLLVFNGSGVLVPTLGALTFSGASLFTTANIEAVGHGTNIFEGAMHIRDDGGTDWVAQSHDGVDFNYAYTNTANVNNTGATMYKFDGALVPGGTISASLTGSVNNYEPTGGEAAVTWVLDADGNYTITSIAGGTEGRILIIVNADITNTITLEDASASGTASNRFLLPGSADHVIAADRGSATIQYLNTGGFNRWVLIGSS